MAVLALLLMSGSAVDAQQPVASSADEAALRDLVRQVQDGWNAHDGKAFAAPFALDADYVIVNGRKITGRKEIEQGHAMIFSTIYKDSHNVGTVKNIRFLRPDIAVVHVEWNLEYRSGAGETVRSRAINTMIMTREGGKWSIAAFHNTPISGV